MPKLQKSFHLEITVEQFLSACSLIELHEIEMRIDTHIRRAKQKEKNRTILWSPSLYGPKYPPSDIIDKLDSLDDQL